MLFMLVLYINCFTLCTSNKQKHEGVPDTLKPSCYIDEVLHGIKSSNTICSYEHFGNNCAMDTDSEIFHQPHDREMITYIKVVNHTIRGGNVFLDIDWQVRIGGSLSINGFLLHIEDLTTITTIGNGLLRTNTTSTSLHVLVRNLKFETAKIGPRISLTVVPLRERRKHKRMKKRQQRKLNSTCNDLIANGGKTAVIPLTNDTNEICTVVRKVTTVSKFCSCWKDHVDSIFSDSTLSVTSPNFCFSRSMIIDSVNITPENNGAKNKKLGNCTYTFHNLTDSPVYNMKIVYKCNDIGFGDPKHCSKVLICNISKHQTIREFGRLNGNPVTKGPSLVVKQSLSRIDDRIDRLNILVIAVTLVFSIIIFIIIGVVIVNKACHRSTYKLIDKEKEKRKQTQMQKVLFISHRDDGTMESNVSLRLMELLSRSFKVEIMNLTSVIKTIFGCRESLPIEKLEKRVFLTICDFKSLVFVASRDLLEMYKNTESNDCVSERQVHIRDDDLFIRLLIHRSIRRILQGRDKRLSVYAHFVSIDMSTVKYCKQLYSIVNPPMQHGRKYCLVKDSKLILKNLRCLVTNLSGFQSKQAIEQCLDNIDANEWEKKLIRMNNYKTQLDANVLPHCEDQDGSKLQNLVEISGTNSTERNTFSNVEISRNHDTDEKQPVIQPISDETNAKLVDERTMTNATDVKSPVTIESESTSLLGSVSIVAEVYRRPSLTSPKVVNDHQSLTTQQETGYFSSIKIDNERSQTVCKDLNNVCSENDILTTPEQNVPQQTSDTSIVADEINTNQDITHPFLPQSVLNQMESIPFNQIRTHNSSLPEHSTYPATSEELLGLSYHESGGFMTRQDNRRESDYFDEETNV